MTRKFSEFNVTTDATGLSYVPFVRNGVNYIILLDELLANALGASVTVSTDGTMTDDSDSFVPTQKAVRTYVNNAVTGLWDMKGTFDASTNPNYPPASKGDAYVVNVPGKVGGVVGSSVESGDIFVAIVDNAGGTQASVGSSWAIVEQNLFGALQSANNLSELTSPATARANLGLGNVNDTSDANKPISTATQTALDLKASLENPTLVTPVLGVATATSINKVAFTTPATSATLTLADGNTLATVGAYVATFTFTSTTGVTFPTSGTLATLTGAETLTNKTFTSPVLSNPSYNGVTSNGGTVTTIDINGGTIDGTVIGGNTPAAGAFTTVSASGDITLANAFFLKGRNVANSADVPIVRVTTSDVLEFGSGGYASQFTGPVAVTGTLSASGGGVNTVLGNQIYPSVATDSFVGVYSDTGAATHVTVYGATHPTKASKAEIGAPNGLTVAGALTATSGYNGTVGATTPAAGAFTTLSATGSMTAGAASEFRAIRRQYDVFGTVGSPAQELGFTYGDITVNTNLAGIWFDNSFADNAASGLSIKASNAAGTVATVGKFSSTGLAITGALSATDNVTVKKENGYYELRLVDDSRVGYVQGLSTGNLAIVAEKAGSSLLLYSNNTLNATLDASGNLGLGVAPSAWSVLKAIEVGGFKGAFYADNGSAEAGIVNGAYYNSGWKYGVTSVANQMRYSQSSTGHYWYTAPSGTAGDPITFTQAMRLDTSGNLYLTGFLSAVGYLQTGDSVSLGVSGAGGQLNYYGDAAGYFEFVNRMGSNKGFKWYTGAGASVVGMTLAADGSLHVSGGGGVATNEAFGTAVLALNTSGSYNGGFGHQVLDANTTGSYNTGVGAQALSANTTGNNNTAVGALALFTTTTGVANSSLGVGSMYSNTTGSFNVALGADALYSNTTGSGNTVVNPKDSTGAYVPVFDPVTENNRLCMGSTGVTNAYVQVAWTVVSDIRDKTDFAEVPLGLDFVCKVDPIAFRHKMSRSATEGHGPLRYGFSAQQVLELEGDKPVIVDAEDPDKLRFNDQSMIAVLVNSIKELKYEFDSYKVSHP